MPRIASFVCIALLTAFSTCLAQESRATLTGTISDPQGAAIPHASVIAKNLATNVETRTETNQSGLYVLPFLDTGTYSVTVAATGFKTELNARLLLTIGERHQLDFKLTLGGVTEQVTVVANTELLQTANASRESLFDAEKIADLPLLGKNTYTLAYQADGVSHINPQPSITDRPFDNGGMDALRINGAPLYTNEYLLDGAPNTNVERGNVNSLSFVPPPDAVGEMAVVSNNYDAQFGRVGGGMISATLKSGGNKVHGAVYEYWRNKILNANLWQSNFAGTARGPFLWNQPGVVANGPVYIPKVYDGRNRTFFLFSWEGIYENIPNPGFETVPTPANRAGDFSSAHTSSGAPITIYDPLTTPLTGSAIRQPFPGNIVPANRMDPVALKMLPFIPLPNFPADVSGFNNFNPTGPSTVTQERYNAFTIKFDQQITQNERFSIHWVQNRRWQTGPYYDFPIPSRGPNNFERYNQGANAQLTSTLSPTMVVTTRFGFTEHIFLNAVYKGGFDPSQLGFPAIYVDQAQGQFFPTESFTNYQGFGQGGNNTDTSTNWYFTSAANKVAGNHSIKFGVEARLLLDNQPNYAFGTFAFSNQWTQRDANNADAQSGNAFASFLLGYPANGSSTINASPAFGNRYYGVYVQDDYRVAPNLTVNLGVRWDYESPMTERYNRENAGFDFTDPNPLQQQAGIPLTGGLLFTSSSNRLPWKRNFNVPQPRIGVAYHFAKNAVFRAGYGLSFLPTFITGQSQGFTVSTPMVTSLNGNLTPAGNFFNPFPTGLIQPAGSALGLATLLGQGISFADTDRTIPFIHQFSAGVQYELPAHVLLDVSYVGSRTRRLGVNQNIDALTAAQLGLGTAYLNTLVANPFAGLLPNTAINGATVQRRQLMIPYPQFTGVTENGIPIGRAWYNALQLQVEKRIAHGFHITYNFTWSETMTASSYLNSQFTGDQLESVRAGEDLPFRASVLAGYQFPFFQHSKPLVKAFLAGWQGQLIAIFQSGRMLGGVAGAYPTGANQFVPGPYTPNGYYFNACSLSTTGVRQNCASATQPVAWIQQPTDTLRVDSSQWQQIREMRPGLMDSSLFKTFYPREGLRLQFRIEAFNTFNTPWFGQANASFGNTRFGLIGNAQTNDPRNVQLALKLTF